MVRSFLYLNFLLFVYFCLHLFMAFLFLPFHFLCLVLMNFIWNMPLIFLFPMLMPSKWAATPTPSFFLFLMLSTVPIFDKFVGVFWNGDVIECFLFWIINIIVLLAWFSFIMKCFVGIFLFFIVFEVLFFFFLFIVMLKQSPLISLFIIVGFNCRWLLFLLFLLLLNVCFNKLRLWCFLCKVLNQLLFNDAV